MLQAAFPDLAAANHRNWEDHHDRRDPDEAKDVPPAGRRDDLGDDGDLVAIHPVSLVYAATDIDPDEEQVVAAPRVPVVALEAHHAVPVIAITLASFGADYHRC